MTAPKARPSTARKHTRTTQEKRTDELERGLRVTLDGESYEVRLADVTPTLARDVRSAAGMSFNHFMDLMGTDPDLDLIAVFVWVARRIAGEKVDLDDIVVSYAQLLDGGFELDVPGKRVEDDGPEA